MRGILLVILFSNIFVVFAGEKINPSQPKVAIGALLDSAKVYVSSNHLKSISFLEKALAASLEQKNNSYNKEIYTLLGDIQYQNGFFEEAIEAYSNSMLAPESMKEVEAKNKENKKEILKTSKSPKRSAYNKESFSRVATDSISIWAKEPKIASSKSKVKGRKEGQMTIEMKIQRCYDALKKLEESKPDPELMEDNFFERENPDAADTFLESDISEQINESIAIEEEPKEFTADLDYRKEYYDLLKQDSVNKAIIQTLRSKQKLSNRLYKTYNSAQSLDKDISIKQQGEVIERSKLDFRNLVIGALAILLVVLGVALIFIRRSQKQSLSANKKLALKSLRTQMNPHFIFNALNSVNNFISLNDERTANKYLSDFSKLMRSVLENSEHENIAISKEIEILKLYLKLEHFRFSDKFNYQFEVDDSIDEDKYGIPPMLIQPYIENAVWHGLRYKETEGLLKVSFHNAGANILVRVADDGIGRKASKALKTKNQGQHKSTGLKNIALRLELLKELGHSKIGVSISNLNTDGSGTLVEVEIPKQVMKYD